MLQCPPACLRLLQVQEAQAALAQLAEERNAGVSEKDAAMQRVVELQGRVEQLQAEIQEARAVGTPHGATALGWIGGFDGSQPMTGTAACMHACLLLLHNFSARHLPTLPAVCAAMCWRR